MLSKVKTYVYFCDIASSVTVQHGSAIVICRTSANEIASIFKAQNSRSEKFNNGADASGDVGQRSMEYLYNREKRPGKHRAEH